jgi:hypothetical protein
MKPSSLIGSALLALGILGAGFFMKEAIVQAKKAERFVTVKGISQRDVKADLGIWEVDYREVGNDLTTLNTKMTQDQQVVLKFLTNNGFNNSEIEIRPTRVTDLLANPYNQPTPESKENRYILVSGIRVRSTQVDQIQKTNQLTSSLIQEGVTLSSDTADYASDLSPNPSFFYTKLDTIRPEMLAEATQSARSVGEQFAKDSRSQLGDIRRANQGLFQISSRDGSSDNNSGMSDAGSINKKVRLVTTIDYYLKN